MAEVDIAGIVRARTEVDQKQEGTFQHQFARLKEQFAQVFNEGDASEVTRDAMFTLLRAFENERLSHEKAIRKAERQIDYCRAMQRSCSVHANLLVDVLTRKAGEWEKRQAEDSGGNGKLADGTSVMSEEEARAALCICACVDDEDAMNCSCSCHDGIPCSDEKCVVCTSKRASGLPTKKKIPKKKRTKSRKGK